MGLYDDILKSQEKTSSAPQTAQSNPATQPPLSKGEVSADPYLPESTSSLQATDVSQEKLAAYKSHGVDLRENVGQFDEQLHENQSTGERLENMVGNLALKTVAYVGQSAGFILGAPAAIATGDITNMTDNFAVKAADGLKDWATQAMPIYKGNNYSNGTIWDKVQTSDWWLDDATDRLALTLSMFVPGTLVSKGFGLVGGLGKILNAANDVEKGVAEVEALDAAATEATQTGVGVLKDMPPSYFESLGRGIKQAFTSAKAGEIVDGASAKFIQQARNLTKAELLVQNTVGQSALGARESQLAVKKTLEDERAQGKNNMSDEEIQAHAVDAAKSVFLENIPAALAMSAWELPQMFSTFNGTKHLWEKALDDELNPIVQTADSFGKKALKLVGKSAFTGLEHGQGENLQVAIGKYNEDAAEGKTSDGVWQGIGKAFVDDFFDPNGQNNIALGTIQGILTSVFGAAGRLMKVKMGKEVSEEQQIQRIQNLVQAAKANYRSQTDFVKRNATGAAIIEDGKPVRDTEKIKNTVVGLVGSIKNATDTQFAAGENDEQKVRLLKHQALATLAHQFFKEPGGVKYLNALLKIHAEEAKNDPNRINDLDHTGEEITPEKELQEHLETVKQLERINNLVESRPFNIDSTNYTPAQKIALASHLQDRKQAIYDNAAIKYFHERELRKTLDELSYNNFHLDPVTKEFVPTEEKMKGLTADHVKDLMDKVKGHKENIDLSDHIHTALTNKKLVTEAIDNLVKESEIENSKQEDKATADNAKVDANVKENDQKIDRLKDIDSEIDKYEEQLMNAGDQATPEELTEITSELKRLKSERESITSKQSIDARNESLSHINQHSLKEGEQANYNGEKVTIKSIDPNSGLAIIDNGRETLSDIPVRDITKIIVPEGTVNDSTSQTMTENPETDIRLPQAGKLEESTNVNVQEMGGRVNVLMNRMFSSIKKKVNGITRFIWNRDSKGFPIPEKNINNIDYKLVNSPTSLLPGSAIEYRIVQPQSDEQKVVFGNEPAIGIYQNDKLVGFVAVPKDVDQTNPDKDFVKKANAERATLIAQRQVIIDRLKGSFDNRLKFTPNLQTWKLGNLEGQKQTKELVNKLNKHILEHPEDRIPEVGKDGESFNKLTRRVLPEIGELINSAPANTIILTHNSVFGLIKTWDEQGRPDEKTQTSLEFRKSYIEKNSNTADFFKLEGKNGPIYVIRHGETEDNVAGNFRTSDTQLTKTGVGQLDTLVENLRKEGVVNPNIVSSNLDRAKKSSQRILDNFYPNNKQQSVTSTIIDKGYGNYIARILSDGHGVFTDNDGNVLSLFDREFREEDKIGGNPVFVVVRNQSLSLPTIEESNELKGKAYKDAMSKLKSDIADLGRHGNNYSKVEGQVFMLVKAANEKWAPIPVYSTLHTEDTSRKVLDIIDRNVAETDFKKLTAELNPLLYAGAEDTRKVKIFQNTGLDGQLHLNIRIDGENYSLDEIKDNSTRRESFRQKLLNQRQNIFADTLNTRDGQDAIRKNKSITTNVILEDGQYFVQPYVEYAPILTYEKTAPVVTTEKTTPTQEQIEQFDSKLAELQKPVQEKPSKDSPEGVAALLAAFGSDEEMNGETGEDIDEFAPKGKNRTKATEPENIARVKSWFKKNLPNIPHEVVDELFRIDGTRVDAWGLFQNNVAKVMREAPRGTSFHEAFHGVFRSMLSDSDKVAVIREAIKKYGLPTLNDLDKLNELYDGKLNDEQLNWLYYEEKLADDFADYTDQFEPKGFLGKIGEFFKRILRIFGLFGGTKGQKINRLFSQINTGKFAKRIPKVANVSRAISEMIEKEPAYRPIVNEQGKSLFTAAYKQQRVTSLANKFQAEFLRMVSAGLDPNQINPTEVYDNLKKEYLGIAQDMLNNPEKYKKVTKINMAKFLDNFDQFKRESNKMLSTMKIDVKNRVIVKQQDDSISEEDDDSSDLEETPSVTGNVTKGLIDRVHISGLSSASTRLKMFVSSIPVKYANGKTKVDDFGDVVYHDFNRLYYYIERNLIGLNTLEDQLEELGMLSANRPELETVIERLTERQPSQSPEEFQRLKDDFTSNFSKQQLGYNMVMTSIDNSTGSVTYSIIDANRSTLDREVGNDWTNNLLKADRNTVSEMKDGVVKMYGTKKAVKAYQDWMELITDKSNMTFDRVNDLLLKIGIEYSPDSLEEILKENSDDFIRNASYMFSYYANENPEDIKSYAMKVQRKLVALETKYMLNRYSSSFQNGEKKNIWTIQLPSFASKIVAKLTNRNVDVRKAEIADLQRDKSNRFSNLINNFKEKAFNDSFRINYLDSLKDKKGNGLGVTFTNINDKDYLAMSIALYHNKETNQNRVATGSVHKYIYITPSDKSMAMLVDSNSYGVTIDTSGKLNRSSEIVEKYYNTVRMEIERISEQLKVAEKVKSGELAKEKLYLHYHYSKSNESFNQADPTKYKFDGFAYRFNEFQGLNEGTKENSSVLSLLTEALKTADYSEVEKQFKEKIITGIINELNTELEMSLDEALDKGIIDKNDETGELINRALDWESKPMQSPLELSHRIRQTLGDFALNQRLQYIELSNLFNGDIAFYKAGDLQKRSYQSQAMGVNVVAAKNETVKTILIKDMVKKADYLDKGNELYNSWTDTLEKLDYSKAVIEKMLSKYKKTNVTDATAVIHPTLYKKLCKRIWTDQLEEAYNIAEGITKNPTDKQLKMAFNALSGVKPFGYGRRFDSSINANVHEQEKTFFIPAFKSLIKGNSLLEKQRQHMDDSGVEMVATESAFKAAIGNRFDVETVTQDDYDNHSFDYLMDNISIQVDNPNHFYNEENDSLRQLKMIMVGAIDETKTYNGKSGKSILDTIDSMESANINESLEKLMREFNSMDDSFKESIRERITKRGSTENMEKMLEIVDGQWTFPLNSGTMEIPIQNMLSSIITNKVIKQAFEGGALVNMSSFGTDSSKFLKQSEIDKNPYLKELQSKLQHLRENKETGVIEHAQAILPAYMKAFYDADNKLKDLKDIDENLKELILYRIPNEFLHSNIPAKVVGFLPPEMGNFVLLPYDITTQMGLDFDFDKLYFIRPEYTTVNGKSTKVEYDNSLSPEKNTREARNNAIFDSYMHLLRSREMFDKIIAPSDFHELAKLKSEIEKEPSDKQTKNRSFFSGITQRELKRRNHTALALKAMTSLEVTGHSYSTKMGLTMKNSMKFNDLESDNLSRINNIDKKNIAQLLSKVQAAVMDDVKDPILDTLGINKNTISVFSAILRAGYSLKTAVNLITQPAIIELSRKLDANNEKTKRQGLGRTTVKSLERQYVNRYNAVKNQLSKERQEELERQEQYYIGQNPTKNLNDSSKSSTEVNQSRFGMEEWRKFAKIVNVNDFSLENVTRNPQIADYYLFQAKVLHNYGNYENIGTALGKLNRFFAINTKIGPNVENINDQVYNMQEILDEENFPIEGVSGYQNIKALDSYAKVLLKSADWFKREFPYDTYIFNSIKTAIVRDQLSYNTPVINKITQDKRMKINGFISSYFDRKVEAFSKLLDNSEQKRLMVDFTKHVSDIKSLKNKEYAGLRSNLFIDAIKVDWRDNGAEGAKFISLRGNKLETNIKDNISEAFYSLYSNPETKELATDFVRYSVLSSGLFQGINSYHDLIPSEILADIGFAEHRKTMNSEFNNNPMNVTTSDEMDRIRELIIRNFPGDFTRVASDSAFTIDRTNNTLTTNAQKVDSANQAYNLITATETEEQPAKFAKYVRVFMSDVNKVELYKNISDKPGEQTYKRISMLGQKARFIEMAPDVNDESLIPSNNYNYTVENANEVVYDPAIHDVNYNQQQETQEGEDKSPVDQATESVPDEDKDELNDQLEAEYNAKTSALENIGAKNNIFAAFEVTDDDARATQEEDDVNEDCNGL